MQFYHAQFRLQCNTPSTYRNRQGKVITEAYTKCYERLTWHGHVVKNFIMDNECSADLRRVIRKVNGDFQLVPPHIHRRNASEKAIRTEKKSFISRPRDV